MGGVGKVGSSETEVAVLGCGEVLLLSSSPDGQARGLAQFQVEALRSVAVTGDGFAVSVPVFAVLSCGTK